MSGHTLQTEIHKGHRSVQTIGGVTVLVLCTFTDDVLHLNQVLRQYLKGFQRY